MSVAVIPLAGGGMGQPMSLDRLVDTLLRARLAVDRAYRDNARIKHAAIDFDHHAYLVVDRRQRRVWEMLVPLARVVPWLQIDRDTRVVDIRPKAMRGGSHAKKRGSAGCKGRGFRLRFKWRFDEGRGTPGMSFNDRGDVMNRGFRLSIALAVALAGSGCVSTNASMLGATTTARPKLMPDQVALYRVASQVPGQYEEIALLNSAGDSGFTDEARMFASMKKKAGEIGANGVILDAVSEPSAGAKVAAAIFGVSAQRKGKAIAIYVIPGTVSPAALPPVNAPVSTAQPAAGPQNVQGCVACANIGKGL